MNHEGERNGRVEVWLSMAEHFLDTETRQDIPLTALCCARAGLSAIEAKRVFYDEVSPAVSFNLWSVAGEWAGWDRAWLVERIERARKPHVRLFERVHPLHGVWTCIERCLAALLVLEHADAQGVAAADWALLGRYYFDFCPADLLEKSVQERLRLCSWYPEPFLTLVGPATARGEAEAGKRRIEAALRAVRLP